MVPLKWVQPTGSLMCWASIYEDNRWKPYDWNIVQSPEGWTIAITRRLADDDAVDVAVSGPYPTLDAAKVVYVLGIATGENT